MDKLRSKLEKVNEQIQTLTNGPIVGNPADHYKAIGKAYLLKSKLEKELSEPKKLTFHEELINKVKNIKEQVKTTNKELRETKKQKGIIVKEFKGKKKVEKFSNFSKDMIKKVKEIKKQARTTNKEVRQTKKQKNTAVNIYKNKKVKELPKPKYNKPITDRPVYEGIIFNPQLYVTADDEARGIKIHPINDKYIKDIDKYNEQKYELEHHYLIKADIIYEEGSIPRMANDDHMLTPEKKKEYEDNNEMNNYIAYCKQRRPTNIQTYGFASNDATITKENLTLDRLQGAINWHIWARDDDYAVKLFAVVIKLVTHITKVKFGTLKCKARMPLHMKLLDEVNIEREKIDNNGLCAIQHILDSIVNVNGFQKYSMDQIINEFNALGCNPADGISVDDIEMWIEKYGKSRLSYIAIDPFGIGRRHYKASDSRFCIVFFVADAHIYGVHLENQKQAIFNKNELSQVNFKDNVMKEYNYINLYDIFTDTLIMNFLLNILIIISKIVIPQKLIILFTSMSSQVIVHLKISMHHNTWPINISY